LKEGHIKAVIAVKINQNGEELPVPYLDIHPGEYYFIERPRRGRKTGSYLIHIRADIAKILFQSLIISFNLVLLSV